MSEMKSRSKSAGCALPSLAMSSVAIMPSIRRCSSGVASGTSPANHERHHWARIAVLAGGHHAGERTQVRIAGFIAANAGDLDALAVVRRHPANVALVVGDIAAKPGDFATMVPEKCKRAKDEQSGRHGIRPVISKALIVLGVTTAEPIPDKRKTAIYRCRRRVHDKANPIGLTQREDRLPKRKGGDEEGPFDRGFSIARKDRS